MGRRTLLVFKFNEKSGGAVLVHNRNPQRQGANRLSVDASDARGGADARALGEGGDDLKLLSFIRAAESQLNCHLSMRKKKRVIPARVSDNEAAN